MGKRKTINDKLLRDISYEMSVAFTETLSEHCRDKGLSEENQWFNNPPDSWSDSERDMFDALSSFDDKAFERISRILAN